MKKREERIKWIDNKMIEEIEEKHAQALGKIILLNSLYFQVSANHRLFISVYRRFQWLINTSKVNLDLSY